MLGAALVLVTAPVSGQSIRGLVLEEGTDAPIELASVVVVTASGDSVTATLTDVNGFFTLSATDGEYILRASALGYRSGRAGPFGLEDERVVRVVQIALAPQPLSIAGLVVEAIDASLATTGFYDRMATGRGQFLTPADIAATGARFTPEVFYGLDHVMPRYDLPVWERWVRFMSTGRGNCSPRIWVDGVWFRWPLPGEGLDDVVRVEDLLAAEVYWGPFQAPTRYQGTAHDNSCGVVLLWTRPGGE